MLKKVDDQRVRPERGGVLLDCVDGWVRGDEENLCMSKVAIPWLRQVVSAQITRVLASDDRGAGMLLVGSVVRHDNWATCQFDQ